MAKIAKRINKLISNAQFIRAREVVEMHRHTHGNDWARVMWSKIDRAATCTINDT